MAHSNLIELGMQIFPLPLVPKSYFECITIHNGEEFCLKSIYVTDRSFIHGIEIALIVQKILDFFLKMQLHENSSMIWEIIWSTYMLSKNPILCTVIWMVEYCSKTHRSVKMGCILTKSVEKSFLSILLVRFCPHIKI